MSNLPTQDTNDIKVVIKKDAKSNFNLVIKDGGIVMNENTGKELDPKKDTKLINKALLKSGLLKYEKITVGNQVYAATAMNTIINITPGSQSNGNTILATSAIGSKVIAQYTGKFTGKVAEVGAEEISKEELDAISYEAEIEASRNPEEETTESPEISDPRMLLMGMNSVDLSNETAIKQEQADISSLDSINASTNVFDMALEADLDPVIPVPKKAPELTSHFNENDSADEITNLFEDEYGCGFI
jgi:hypothetical protein